MSDRQGPQEVEFTHRPVVAPWLRYEHPDIARDVIMKKMGLVVDDDDSTRFVLSRALQDLGFSVVVAEDGAEVPELIASQRFDLLVVDLYMPGMNGFELLRHIRHRDPGIQAAARTPSDVSVLVVSGESYAASIANAKALGADEYLVKPIDAEIFAQTVRKLLAAEQTQKRPHPS